MTLRSGSIAAVSVACALAAAILIAVTVIERVMPATEPVAPAINPWAPPAATAPPDAAPAAPPPVELLHAVPSTVAVSSTVDNAAILPEHLVDRDLATAWNSRTGDTTGAWIAFRVPREVHVDQIRMSAGFTHRGPDGDLFTMNQRIRQVRVSRAGTVILEKRLDPGSRNLQELPIDAAGGDFRIEVTELVPGTEPRWREVCVSELEVWGTLPASMTPRPQQPTVRVGSLDAAPPAPPADPEVLSPLPAGPFRSSDDFCERWSAPRERAEDARQKRCSADPQGDGCDFLGCGPWVHCEATDLPADPSDAPGKLMTSSGPPPASLGPFRAAEVVTITESTCSSPTCYLAITDARGTWLVHEINACGSAEGMSAWLQTVALRVVDHKLRWQYAHHVRMDGVTDERVTVECGAGGSAPECTESTE